MSTRTTRLLAIPLALIIGGVMLPSAHSQSDVKTGEGPRGTKVAPSTDPGMAGATSAQRPPQGMAKSGTPTAGSNDEMANKAGGSKVKAKGP